MTSVPAERTQEAFAANRRSADRVPPAEPPGRQDAPREVRSRPPWQLRDTALSLLALNAFGIVQPILERLGLNVQYLTLQSISGLALASAIVVLLTAIPMTVTSVVWLLSRMGMLRAARNVTRAAMALLSTLTLLVYSRTISASLELLSLGVPDLLLAGCSIVGGVLLTRLYERAGWWRQLLCVSSLGCIVFPALFVSVPAVQRLYLHTPGTAFPDGIRAETPSPVLLIVFDGLNGMSLLNDCYEIDAARYPGFARLGQMSTFYRNASTVHTRTDHAVPAILSGRLPEEVWQPVETDYPAALFRMIYETHQFDMTVFEPFTRLAPSELRRLDRTRGPVAQVAGMLPVLAKVYLKVTLPRDVAILNVTIPRIWFGLVDREPGERSQESGLVVYGMDASRETQCAHFLDELHDSPHTPFQFLHVVVPHDPFSLLPTGTSFRNVSLISDTIYGAASEEWCDDPWPVHQAWQKYLLQVQFVDRWLNRYLERLDELGTLDETLVIVTGDHGLAFVAGEGRRTPVADTLPDIVSVPVFIKLPGQSRGAVSDRNVETTDILPTIADTLGLPKDASWDGESLLDSTLPARQRKLVRGAIDTVLDPDFPQRFRYVDRMVSVFGTGDSNDRLHALHLEPELIGRTVASLAAGSPSGLKTSLIAGGATRDPQVPNVVPCALHGRLATAADDAVEHRIAVALNGIILATTRTSVDRHCWQEWSALLPEEAYQNGQNELQVFELTGLGAATQLHEIVLESFSD